MNKSRKQRHGSRAQRKGNIFSRENRSWNHGKAIKAERDALKLLKQELTSQEEAGKSAAPTPAEVSPTPGPTNSWCRGLKRLTYASTNGGDLRVRGEWTSGELSLRVRSPEGPLFP